jgi:hypothetical protein
MHFAFLASNLIVQASTEVQFQIMRDLDGLPNPLLLCYGIHGSADISFAHASHPGDLGARRELRQGRSFATPKLGHGYAPLALKFSSRMCNLGGNSVSHICSLPSAFFIRVTLVVFIFFVWCLIIDFTMHEKAFVAFIS